MQELITKYLSRQYMLLVLILASMSFSAHGALFSIKDFEKIYVESQTRIFYDAFGETDMSFMAWDHGFRGYIQLFKKGELENPRYFTVIDFTQPSSEKRLYVIDLVEKTIVFNSLVSHGRNSGGLMAETFSNVNSSYQSSLGFYKTAETYSGKFDYAMRLDGLEASNSNARERAIVVHGADYATEVFLKRNNGVLGRSLGCPALPKELARDYIDLVKKGSCLFIYADNKEYKQLSKLMNYVPGIDDLAQLECLVEEYS